MLLVESLFSLRRYAYSCIFLPWCINKPLQIMV